jgi:hypothetical protein
LGILAQGIIDNDARADVVACVTRKRVVAMVYRVGVQPLSEEADETIRRRLNTVIA